LNGKAQKPISNSFFPPKILPAGHAPTRPQRHPRATHANHDAEPAPAAPHPAPCPLTSHECNYGTMRVSHPPIHKNPETNKGASPDTAQCRAEQRFASLRATATHSHSVHRSQGARAPRATRTRPRDAQRHGLYHHGIVCATACRSGRAGWLLCSVYSYCCC
jgi:hypothetical protein